MNSNKQNTSRLSTLPALTQQFNVNNFVIDDVRLIVNQVISTKKGAAYPS